MGVMKPTYFILKTRILTRGVEHTAYIYIYKHYRLIELPWNSAFTWYLSAIFVDFCYYWGHRASHGKLLVTYKTKCQRSF